MVPHHPLFPSRTVYLRGCLAHSLTLEYVKKGLKNILKKPHHHQVGAMCLSWHRRLCARSQRKRAFALVLDDIIVFAVLVNWACYIVLLGFVPCLHGATAVFKSHALHRHDDDAAVPTQGEALACKASLAFFNAVSKSAWTVPGRSKSISFTSITFSSWGIRPLPRIWMQVCAMRVFSYRRRAWRSARASKV